MQAEHGYCRAHTKAWPWRSYWDVLPAQESADSFEVLVVAALPAQLSAEYGAPAQVWYHISSPSASDRLLYDVLWVNKTATRLPEARDFTASPPGSLICRRQRPLGKRERVAHTCRTDMFPWVATSGCGQCSSRSQ